MNRRFPSNRQANLAQIIALKRRVSEQDFTDLDEEGEVVDIVEAKRRAYGNKYGSTHPVLTPPRRRDIDD